MTNRLASYAIFYLLLEDNALEIADARLEEAVLDDMSGLLLDNTPLEEAMLEVAEELTNALDDEKRGELTPEDVEVMTDDPVRLEVLALGLRFAKTATIIITMITIITITHVAMTAGFFIEFPPDMIHQYFFCLCFAYTLFAALQQV